MAEDTKLPVQDDEAKLENVETTDELNESDLEQVAGGRRAVAF